MRLWWGRPHTFDAQVINAHDNTVSLAPASQAPAALVKSHWLALQNNQVIPLVGENRYGFNPEDPELRD